MRSAKKPALRNPFFRASIAGFRHRLLRVGFSGSDAGPPLDDPVVFDIRSSSDVDFLSQSNQEVQSCRNISSRPLASFFQQCSSATGVVDGSGNGTLDVVNIDGVYVPLSKFKTMSMRDLTVDGPFGPSIAFLSPTQLRIVRRGVSVAVGNLRQIRHKETTGTCSVSSLAQFRTRMRLEVIEVSSGGAPNDSIKIRLPESCPPTHAARTSGQGWRTVRDSRTRFRRRPTLSLSAIIGRSLFRVWPSPSVTASGTTT